MRGTAPGDISRECRRSDEDVRTEEISDPRPWVRALTCPISNCEGLSIVHGLLGFGGAGGGISRPAGALLVFRAAHASDGVARVGNASLTGGLCCLMLDNCALSSCGSEVEFGGPA